MVEFACSCLREAGHEPVLAWYEPYSQSPKLSVPLWALPFRRPGAREVRSWNGCEGHAIGAWLPELEFTHYRPTRTWRELMDSCEAYVTVSGNCLAAAPFALTGRPFMAWVATPWAADRVDRVADFPLLRKMVDFALVRPWTPFLERKVLKSGLILGLSRYSKGRLEALGGGIHVNELPFPVDAGFFSSDPRKPIPGRIGFTGRLDDPRKNVSLLLDAIAILKSNGSETTALLIGADSGSKLAEEVAVRGLTDRVEIMPYLAHDELRPILQSLDVFVVPSRQEGLCISALEAMACGCPVVSTRCGGPEEFVIPGETGYLTDFNADDFAVKIATIVQDRRLRERLSIAARAMVEKRYSEVAAKEIFTREFDRMTHQPQARSLQ